MTEAQPTIGNEFIREFGVVRQIDVACEKLENGLEILLWLELCRNINYADPTLDAGACVRIPYKQMYQLMREADVTQMSDIKGTACIAELDCSTNTVKLLKLLRAYHTRRV